MYFDQSFPFIHFKKKKKHCLWHICWKYIQKKRKNGFSLIEVLIIAAIIGLLSVSSIFAYQSFTQRSRDAQRKSDLQEIQIALEEYYNDNGCYPTRAQLLSCGSSELSPYLAAYPCDPQSQAAYLYVPEENNCRGYRLHAALENTSDPVIAQLECDGPAGCGYGNGYNYGVSSGTLVTTSQPLPEPSADPGSFGGPFACDPVGNCNSYGSAAAAEAAGCPISFVEISCQNVCGNPLYRCP